MHTKNTNKFMVMIAAFSVVLMIFAVIIMVTTAPQADAAGKQCAHAHSARTLAQKRAAVYCIINAERAAAGIRPYEVDKRSELAAQRHSADMAKRGYFSHNAPSPAPNGRGPEDRMISAGFPAEIYDPGAFGWSGYDPPEKYKYDMKGTNELIAIATTPWDVVRVWLGSRTGHCNGIMDPNGDRVGVGYVDTNWTLDYLGRWHTFQTGEEVPWSNYPNCPRKPRTNHPPRLRVVKAIRRGKQLTVRLKSNIARAKVRVKVSPQNGGRTIRKQVCTNKRGIAFARFRVRRGSWGFVFAELIVNGKKAVISSKRF